MRNWWTLHARAPGRRCVCTHQAAALFTHIVELVYVTSSAAPVPDRWSQVTR